MRSLPYLAITSLLAVCITGHSLAANVTTSQAQLGNLFSIQAQITIHQTLYAQDHDTPYPSIEALTAQTNTPWSEGAQLYRDASGDYLYFTDTVKAEGTLTRTEVKNTEQFQAHQGLCESLNADYPSFHCALADNPFTPTRKPVIRPVEIGERVYVWMKIK